jgi:hypothetical protein
MAYTKHRLQPLVCEWRGCMKNATHTVKSDRKWRLGDYCEKHADHQIKRRADEPIKARLSATEAP